MTQVPGSLQSILGYSVAFPFSFPAHAPLLAHATQTPRLGLIPVRLGLE